MLIYVHFLKQVLHYISEKMSNYTDNETGTVHHTSSPSFPIPVAIIGLIVSSMNIIVNFSVLVIFLRKESVRSNRHHNLVICLCISDFYCGMGGFLGTLRLLVNSWSPLYLPCLSACILITVSVLMSLFQTFLISFHRFLVSINSPWNDYLLRGKRKYVIYVLSWTIAFSVQPIFIGPSSNDSNGICNFKNIYNKNRQVLKNGFGWTSLLLLMCTIVMYVFTLNNVRKQYTKTYAWQIENSSPQDNINKNKLYITELRQNVFLFKSLKIVGIILALLIFLRGPFLVISFIGMHGFEASHGTIVITGVLLGLHSVINPFIYSWKIESLRKELKLLFVNCSCHDS